jgi:hypothetical protein
MGLLGTKLGARLLRGEEPAAPNHLAEHDEWPAAEPLLSSGRRRLGFAVLLIPACIVLGLLMSVFVVTLLEGDHPYEDETSITDVYDGSDSQWDEMSGTGTFDEGEPQQAETTVMRTFASTRFCYSLTYPSSLQVGYQQEGGHNNEWFDLRLQGTDSDDHSIRSITVACRMLPDKESIHDVYDKHRRELRRWTRDSVAHYHWVWTYTTGFHFTLLGPHRALVASYCLGAPGEEHRFIGKQYILTDDHRHLFDLAVATESTDDEHLKTLETAAATFRMLTVSGGNGSPTSASD